MDGKIVKGMGGGSKEEGEKKEIEREKIRRAFGKLGGEGEWNRQDSRRGMKIRRRGNREMGRDVLQPGYRKEKVGRRNGKRRLLCP